MIIDDDDDPQDTRRGAQLPDTVQLGERAFSYAGPLAWNALLTNSRHGTSPHCCKHKLNTFGLRVPGLYTTKSVTHGQWPERQQTYGCLPSFGASAPFEE